MNALKIAAAIATVLLSQAAAFSPNPSQLQSCNRVPHKGSVAALHATMPSHSPATSLPNQIYNWRNYKTRYQVSGPSDAERILLLVHGLFVNSDHWRKMLTGLKDQNVRVYAIDLLGSGWSDKPSRTDAQSISGENGRFTNCPSTCYREVQQNVRIPKTRTEATMRNVPLGTSSGGNRIASELELRHPLSSPYNFYTWAEQVNDFVHDVIYEDVGMGSKVTLVANSIGTMSSLQSVIDEPDLFNVSV